MDKFVEVSTSGGSIVATPYISKEYPAVEICINDRLVVVVEKSEPGGGFIAHIYADDKLDEPTQSIELD